MSNTDSTALIVGFLMPAAIAAISREHWSGQVKAVVAFVVCLLAAAGTAWYERSLDFHDARNVFPLVFGAAIASYHTWWRPSGIADAISTNVNAGAPQSAPVPAGPPAPAAKTG